MVEGELDVIARLVRDLVDGEVAKLRGEVEEALNGVYGHLETQFQSIVNLQSDHHSLRQLLGGAAYRVFVEGEALRLGVGVAGATSAVGGGAAGVGAGESAGVGKSGDAATQLVLPGFGADG